MKKGNKNMGLKPGPKPTAKSTGKLDQRRRDNKSTPGNTKSLKPSKNSKAMGKGGTGFGTKG